MRQQYRSGTHNYEFFLQAGDNSSGLAGGMLALHRSDTPPQERGLVFQVLRSSCGGDVYQGEELQSMCTEGMQSLFFLCWRVDEVFSFGGGCFGLRLWVRVCGERSRRLQSGPTGGTGGGQQHHQPIHFPFQLDRLGQRARLTTALGDATFFVETVASVVFESSCQW